LLFLSGSSLCRVGWTTSPSPLLAFKPVFGRTRKEKGKAETELLVANDIANIEAVRFNLKTPFDRQVVTQGDYQERLLDYAFQHLGIGGEGVAHPVLVTEAVANPNSSRASKALWPVTGF
jgi:actin-related protein 5